MKPKKIALLLAFSVFLSGLQATNDINAVSYYQKKTVTLKNATNITVNGKAVKSKKIVKIMCKKEGKYTICYKKNGRKHKKVIWIDTTAPKIEVEGEKNENGAYKSPAKVILSDNMYLKQYEVNGNKTVIDKNKKVIGANAVLQVPGTYCFKVVDKAGKKTSATITVVQDTSSTSTTTSTINPTTSATTTPSETEEKVVLHDVNYAVKQINLGSYKFETSYMQNGDSNYYFISNSITMYGYENITIPNVKLAFYDANKKCIGYYSSSRNSVFYNWKIKFTGMDGTDIKHCGCQLTMSKEETGCDFSDIKYWAVVNSDPRN